jgi:aspartate/methionine/tyrosine aminotransferase
MRFVNCLKALSRNIFADMDPAKAESISAGKTVTDLFDLFLVSSDFTAPDAAIAAIQKSLGDPTTDPKATYCTIEHSLFGKLWLAKWYTYRFDIEIDTQTEVLPLIGSQQETGHLPLTILNLH